MTPTLAHILHGQVVALAAPPPPEASGDYMAARIGMVSMLAGLAGQEVERGFAARVFENDAMRALFAEAAPAYDAALAGRLGSAAQGASDLTVSGLDALNAELRRVLIDLHTEVEARRDAELDREILNLYRRMAFERRLELPLLARG